MEPKILIFEDIKTAELQIAGMKELWTAAVELKDVFDSLNLGIQFSRDIFTKLVDSDSDFLIETAYDSFNQQFDKSKMPEVYRQFVSKINFKEVLKPLDESLTKIREIIARCSADHFFLKFKGSQPIFTGQDEGEIREMHKYYAETPDQKKLYELILTYCDASNQLETFIKEQADPPLFNELNELHLSNSFWVYLDEDGMVKPNYRMFTELKKIKMYKKQ